MKHTWSVCSKTPTSVLFMPREWPSCLKTFSLPEESVENELNSYKDLAVDSLVMVTGALVMVTRAVIFTKPSSRISSHIKHVGQFRTHGLILQILFYLCDLLLFLSCRLICRWLPVIIKHAFLHSVICVKINVEITHTENSKGVGSIRDTFCWKNYGW